MLVKIGLLLCLCSIPVWCETPGEARATSGASSESPTAQAIHIVLDGARKLCLALPHTALCQELFNASIAAGEGGLDDSALVRVIERLANHELG